MVSKVSLQYDRYDTRASDNGVAIKLSQLSDVTATLTGKPLGNTRITRNPF